MRLLYYVLGGAGLFYLGKVVYDMISLSDLEALAATCSTEFTAHNHAGKRDTSTLRWIVVHDTEGDTARGAASWFSQTTPISEGGPGSTQIVVGEDGCYRTLSDDVVPYGAGGHANAIGLHVELAGHSSLTRDQWLARSATLRRAAAWLATWSSAYGIPLTFVDAAGLLRGESGVTTHAEVSKAFPSDTNHTDPGKNFPMDALLDLAGGSGSSYPPASEGGIA